MKVQRKRSTTERNMRSMRAVWLAWKRLAGRFIIKPDNAKKIAIGMIVLAVVMIVSMTVRASNSQNIIDRFISGATSFVYAVLLVVSVWLLILIHKKSQAIASSRSLLATSDAPPHYAELLLHFLLPAGNRDAVLGDLEEHHAVMLARFGKRESDAWYRFQTARSIVPSFVGFYDRARLWIVSGGLVWLVKSFAPSLLPAVQRWLDKFTTH